MHVEKQYSSPLNATNGERNHPKKSLFLKDGISFF